MIYLMDEPFECFSHGRRGWVTAYLDDSFFVWVSEDGCHSCVGISSRFDPSPPIPAAARKPKVGEIWISFGEPILLVSWNEDNWRILFPCHAGSAIVSRDSLVRPATPEEAEPFRELFDGLKASFGEA